MKLREGRGRVGASLRLVLLGTATAVSWSIAAHAQDAADAAPPAPARDEGDGEIVVVGSRASVLTDVAPVAVFDANAVAATGATTTGELLRTIRATTTGADGSDPIFLLNSQRVSGYQEIGTLPPEAIAKIEVFPEPVALKFGFPPTRRVVNFITKSPFRQVELRATAGTGPKYNESANVAAASLTRLRDGSRLSVNLEYRHNEAIRQSDRDVAPDPDVPFDAIGNVRGLSGEVDPALSAAFGRPVLIAAVPQDAADRSRLAAYLPGANALRLFDLSPYRTLRPRNDAVKADAVLADRIGATMSGSVSLSAEHVRERSIYGPASATLLVPAGNPFSPFSGPVLLYRYLTEGPNLGQVQTTTTLHGGFMLRGALAGWRWDLTGQVDQKQVDGRTGTGIDAGPANAAIPAGANPFAPLTLALLGDPLVSVTRNRTRSTGMKAVATNTPVTLPAGKASVTATVEAEKLTADSFTRSRQPFELHLGRTRAEAAVSLDVPITSRREHFMDAVGDLSVNASFTARTVGGYGGLHDSTYGLAWSPITGLQLLATWKHSAAAPDLAAQATPVIVAPEVPVFDFGTGRTEIATVIQGGNPDLRAERRSGRSLTLSLKPFAKKELRFTATYETTTIRDASGTIYALTPQTEALAPDLIVRDAAGRLVSVAYRPINFYRERQRTLNLTFGANGRIGKAPKPAPGAKPPAVWYYYGGMGPSIRFEDRLQLRPGTPELDLLAGDSVTGSGEARVFGYAYGGINKLGNGLKFDGWYGGGSRVRSFGPEGELNARRVIILNVGGSLSLHHFFPKQKWTSHLGLKLDIGNLLDSRPRITTADGRIPNRYQRDLLDPVGRTYSLTLRKLF